MGAAATVAALLCSPSPSPAQDAPLVGLWSGVQHVGRPFPTAVVLVERGNALTAIVGHDTVRAPLHGDSAHLTFADGAGTLRLFRETRTRSWRAYWVQPPGIGSSYATPVRLWPQRAGTWRSDIHAVPSRFTLHLAIWRDSTDSLRAVLRNPEWNFSFGRLFTVLPSDSAIALVDLATGRRRYTQPYDSAARTITFDFGAPLLLRPSDPDTATGFRARLGPSPARLTPPQHGADGWTVSTPAAAGMDGRHLLRLVQRIATADPTARETPRVHSVVAARGGRLVLDEYFYGYTADDLHELRSASKTVTSIMLGAAMRTGVPLSPQTVVLPSGVTLGHLLTHTSGLACNDDDDASPGNEDRMQAQDSQPDWHRYTRGLAQLYAPGTAYAYCSGGINLVGGVIADATKRWLPDYFDTMIARPLGIAHFGMNLMPNGEGYAGGGLHLRPRDLLKLGELYLRGGRWGNRRIVDASWVRQSTARQQPIASGADDGYAWHRHEVTVRGRKLATYEASGNGGQFVVVIPALDLVVAVTAGHYGEGTRWMALRDEIVGEVAAAVR